MQDLDCEARSIRSTCRSLDQSNSSSTNGRFNILRRTIPILNEENNKSENSIFSDNTISINNISSNTISLNNININNISFNSILSVDSNDENKSKQFKKTNSLLSRRNKISPADENSDNFSSLINITAIVNEQSSIIDGYINSVQSSFLIPKKLTVMVVDDSAMNRKIVRRTIEGYRSVNALTGCQVAIEEADDGLTAIEKYKAITSDNNESVDLFVLGEIFLLDLFIQILLLMRSFIIIVICNVIIIMIVKISSSSSSSYSRWDFFFLSLLISSSSSSLLL